MFNGLKVYVHPDGIIKARKKILETQFVKNGGVLATNLKENNIDYILVDDDLNVSRIFNKFDTADFKTKNIKILKTRWLSNCVKEKSLISDTTPYEVKFDEVMTKKVEPPIKKPDSPQGPEVKRKKVDNEQDVYDMTTESSSNSSDEEPVEPVANKTPTVTSYHCVVSQFFLYCKLKIFSAVICRIERCSFANDRVRMLKIHQ